MTGGSHCAIMAPVMDRATKRPRKIRTPRTAISGHDLGEWYTVQEVAAHFRKSSRTILRWIHRGLLNARKFGGKEWRISKDEIVRFELGHDMDAERIRQ